MTGLVPSVGGSTDVGSLIQRSAELEGRLSALSEHYEENKSSLKNERGRREELEAALLKIQSVRRALIRVLA